MKRILHTMLRVSDLDNSIKFYTEIMGMKLLRTLEQSEEDYTLVFLGYGAEINTAVLELTYNHGVTEYNMGNAYGHIAVSVENIVEESRCIKEKGGEFSLEVTPLNGSNELIAFVVDPDGYQIELIEHK
ncbi:MAG: lactoylglutathione lyase [endosymbiont of Galathealinum brachiosum]|uniref:Lactoylglutathione lyase n=1 Tax=endosymbiont of Galathealinum brachiosum TaxID=2200906 RepID=A0A370DLW0_9GAMM|nr:MAG: lactoylglutathione lyase [endosymbiont of Galathealinum brachiosum]